jgi:endonuclease/exonuclease/phosphatase (EEP) superfamily protein YafD
MFSRVDDKLHRLQMILGINVCLDVFGLTLIANCGYVTGVWYCDLLSQFRLVYFFLSLFLVAFLLALRQVKAFSFCLICVLVQSLPFLFLWLPAVRTEPANLSKDKVVLLSVLNFNTEFQDNNHYDRLQQLIEKTRPDLIVLSETDQRWLDAISESTSGYPFRIKAIQGPGMAVYSKLPLLRSEVRYFGKSHHPRISGVLDLSGQELSFFLIHPTTPKTEAGYRERTAELALVAEEMEEISGAKMLLGDFNCGPWSQPFLHLLDTGLRDSEQGFGPQPTWPARKGRLVANVSIPPFVPIDHVLVSNSIAVLERKVGPAINSDHLPVYARLAVVR